MKTLTSGPGGNSEFFLLNLNVSLGYASSGENQGSPRRIKNHCLRCFSARFETEFSSFSSKG